MVGRTVVPKDVHALIPETCVCLHGKRHFTNIIKLKIWTWEDYPGLFKGSNVVTGDLLRGRQEGQSHNRRCVNGSRGQREKVRFKATLLDIETDYEPREAGGLWRSQGNRFITRASRKDVALLTHFRLLT